MSVLKFAEEFTRLILHYTRASSLNNDPNTITSLSDEQIVTTIHHVLHAISIQGFNKNKTLSDISNTAAIISETAMMNVKHESDTEDRSQDAQSVFTDDDSCISDISSKASKKGQENSFSAFQNENQFISRSTPMICINNLNRSDTFVREESQKIHIEDHDDVFEDFTNAETDDLSNNLQVSLSEIRKSVMDVMGKLNNLEQSFLQSIRSPKNIKVKVQQSSLIHGRHRTSTTNETKILTNTRKSNSASKAIKSSKLVTKNGNAFERRKSTGGIGTNARVEKSGEHKVNCSIPNTTLSCNKTSPGSSEFPNQPKFTKNPKYAHVRSTIPKAIQRKKVQ